MSLFEPPPLPGDQVATYKLLETLGIGGNATVYKATCPTHGYVAIKVLHPGKTSNEDIKRFYREYVSLQKLKHPNIVQVFNSGTHGEYPWIAMELVEGPDLGEQIEIWHKENNSTFKKIKSIFIQICTAIEHIHKQGMIHRDLKPSNILITKDGKPKITDFGGVKAPTTFHSELTTMGKLVGTVAFMAPEHILGEQLDSRADLYSLGALLYMCLTGRKPFEAQNISGYLSLHLTKPPPNPQELLPEIPKDLNDTCLRLMQKDRKERFQTAQIVIDFLNKSSKKSTTPTIIGLEEEREIINNKINAFLQGQNTLICLYGFRGTGKTNLIRNIIRVLKENKIHISLNEPVLIAEKPRQAFILDAFSIKTDSLAHVRQSINEGKQIFTLITSPGKTIFYEEALGIPCEKVYVRPLKLTETQRILSLHNITGKSNLILSQRLHNLFKGRHDYIQESLRITIKEPKNNIRIRESRNIKIEIPNIVRKNSIHNLSKLSPIAKQILECILVYRAPLSKASLLRLCEQELSDVEKAINQLELQHWITFEQKLTEQIIELEKHHLEDVLYQLLKKDRRILWHRRIAAILKKQRRLKSDEQLLLAHHFEKAEWYQEAFVTLIAVAPKIQSLQKLKEVLCKAEKLLEPQTFDVTQQQLLTFYELFVSLYTQNDNSRLALDYISRALLLQLTDQQKAKLEIQSTIFQYNAIYSERSLKVISKDDPLWVEGMKISALHEFLEGRQHNAEQYWSALSENSHPTAKMEGIAGLHLLKSTLGERGSFLSYISKNHQSLPDYWLIWLIENYLCMGNWQEALILSQDVSIRLQNDPVLCTRALALEGLLHLFMGKPSHAYQVLSTIKSMLLAPFDISSTRSSIHISRLTLALGKELPTYSFNWNDLPVHIDDLHTQWLMLTNRYRQQPPVKIPSVPIPWTQDIILYDIAHSIQVSPTLESLENIWENLSNHSLAIRLIIAKHFLFITSKSIWKKRFTDSLEQCQNQYADDYYDFSNWKY
jgi:serine/threonine protein kinase